MTVEKDYISVYRIQGYHPAYITKQV